ncbi:hypothetical protein [Mucilaginibacter sp. SP1R1]|uniref:hypothetical protein n=1 Tax=Mucilaginibacter sp. SP1R1 TaxID=2723091 RepID=UPI00161EE44E|nr:hypothetical protein [Mucilaginibacter sp. SP1R1]MBB6152769.1 hypothetical protein [Mucilaginibacter sp. SP1R1]
MSNPKNKLKLVKETLRNHKSYLKAKARESKFQTSNIVAIQKQNFIVETELKLINQTKNQVFGDFAELITPGTGELIIKIPTVFCLESNYSECMQTIKEFASSLYDNLGGHILIDFSKCSKVDSGALFVFQIIRLEIVKKLKFLQTKIKYNVIPELNIKVPKSKDVIRLLIIMGYPISPDDIKNQDEDSTLNPFHFLGFLKGSASQKHYFENKKSVYSANVVSYINSCLDEHGYVLSEDETNNIDGIIAEVLSNAEDHSGQPDWYLTANFSKEMSQIGEEDVGELNIVIMNFGNSIYEAFLETKEKNNEMYVAVKNYVTSMINNHDFSFNEEQLYTLATMQEQTSRLKFERQSRGTGTIKFINSFLELGDFEDKAKNYVPNLSIYTGKVHLVCDNQFKPRLKDNIYYLSLNPENDLAVPPRASHLKKLKSKFPGTLLSLKLYLNKKHFDNKYGGNYGN